MNHIQTLEAFASHAFLYGTVTHDKRMQDSGGKQWRETRLAVDGKSAYVLKCNGETIRAEWEQN